MDEGCCIEHSNTEEILFTHKKIQTICKGRCIDHTNEYTTYNGLDKDTGELYIIKEISFDDSKHTLESIKLRLSNLVELQHDNLFEIKNFVHLQTSTSKQIFYILQKFDFGYINLSLFLSKNITLEKEFLKSLGKHILETLNYLKEKDLQSVNLSYSAIYVNNEGSVKLYDYGLDTCSDNVVTFSNENSYKNTFKVLLISLLRGEWLDCNKIHSSPINYQLLFEKYQTVEEVLDSLFLEPESNLNVTRDISRSSKQEYSRKVSRPEKYFEVIEKLGKGRFGKVYKIKDRTDQKLYALKKIKLCNNNDESKRTILNEVQYLSALDHKHIVRYYHATLVDSDHSDSDSDNSDSEDEETEEDEDDDECGSSQSDLHNLYIESNYSGIKCYSHEDFDKSISADKDELVNMFFQQTLYIKMELCDSNTLEHVINTERLFARSTCIWKYFKQILKGLQHIHDKQIVHRDLKPNNIFLDSNDQIKIGDFGLATQKMRYHPLNKENDKKNKMSESGTSRVGTFYYKAPELSTDKIVICNDKIDMYSLGIILFEMCYEPFSTLSERHKILSDLRTCEIIFPKDFNEIELKNQMDIIRNLLSHEASQRPSCQDLIDSEFIPHLLEEKEEKEQLQIMGRMATNFPTKFFNFFYDKNMNSNLVHYNNITFTDGTLRIITDVFRKHGAQNLDFSVLSLNATCKGNCKFCTKFINEEGKVFILPCYSRIPFIRYAVSNNHSWIRRYTIQKNYSGQDYECSCAFDIITPMHYIPKSVLPEAEILFMLSELINSFPRLLSCNSILKVNHSDFIEAIREECDLLEESYSDILKSAHIVLNKKYPVCDSCINRIVLFEPDKMSRYIEFMRAAHSFDYMNVSDIAKEFKNPTAANKAAKALSELSNIVTVAYKLGTQCEIILQPSLSLHEEHYSGFMVQLSYYDNGMPIVLAEGGVYDEILKQVCNSYGSNSTYHGVGVVVYPESVIKSMKASGSLSLSANEVLIVQYSKKFLPEVYKILKDFWKNNISCSFVKMKNRKELCAYCSKNNIFCTITVNYKLFKKKKVKFSDRCSEGWEVDLDHIVEQTRAHLYPKPRIKIDFTSFDLNQ